MIIIQPHVLQRMFQGASRGQVAQGFGVGVGQAIVGQVLVLTLGQLAVAALNPAGDAHHDRSRTARP